MNGRVILYSFLFTFIFCVKCERKEGDRPPESKKFPSLPYFRRKVEELGDADFFETTETGDPHNLVNFLIENMNIIFDDIQPEEKEKNITLKKRPQRLFLSNTSIPIPPRTSLSTVTIRSILDFFSTEDIMSSRSVPTSTHTKDLILNENLTLTTSTYTKDLILNENSTLTTSKHTKDLMLNENLTLTTSTYAKDLMLYENLTLTTLLDVDQSSVTSEKNTSIEFMKLSKYVNYNTNDNKERDASGRGNATEGDGEFTDPRRSCIMCNNVATEECNDPKNKLITSIMCERDDDLCYSLHTPFGIVDRGCFNVNHNLTTYVCSCNLCNYISISEMPFMFTNKKNWVNNVIELSRTKNFRKSVFKDMSCLKCEVNTTSRTGDMLDSANCLEGNIGNLPMEDCNIDEVCGVKALRAEGYIWRGCMKIPLYNYWWSICDRDLCNYDTLVTLFEFVV